MNIVYLVSQIVGFVAFVISLVAYHRKKKEKIFKTMMLANLLDITHYLLLGAYSEWLSYKNNCIIKERNNNNN